MNWLIEPSRSGSVGFACKIGLAGLMVLLALGTVVFAGGTALAGSDPLTTRTIKRAFSDARIDLQNAIINQGLKVDLNGHVGDMLRRTGADIGAKGTVFTDAEYFTFCSSQLTREMVQADPTNMGMCPYTMFIYHREGSEDVTVGYKAMIMRGNEASQKALAKINDLMQAILDEATE